MEKKPAQFLCLLRVADAPHFKVAIAKDITARARSLPETRALEQSYYVTAFPFLNQINTALDSVSLLPPGEQQHFQALLYRRRTRKHARAQLDQTHLAPDSLQSRTEADTEPSPLQERTT